MKIAIISLNSESSKMIGESCREYFKDVDMISLKEIEVHVDGKGMEVLHNGVKLKDYDCVYCRASYKYVLLTRSITSALREKCYMPLSAGSFTIGHAKFLTQLSMQKYNVNMPKTYLAGNTSNAKEILKNIHFPAIIKIPSGTHGKGVMFADSMQSAKSLLDTMDVFKQPVIIQEYIETNATDIRVLVVGGKVVGCMKRKAGKDELRANIHMGGTGKKHSLSDDAEKMAVRASVAVRADICAIDLLEKGKDYKVIEVNVSPGIQGLTKATGKDIAGEIAKTLFEKTKEWKNKHDNLHYKEMVKDMKNSEEKEIATTLDIKAGIIKLPSIVTQLSGFGVEDNVHIKVKKGKIVVDKSFSLEKKNS